MVTIIVISDNKVTVTRVENNLSTNNYIIVNIGIKRAIINSVYKRKIDSASILSIIKAYYSTKKQIIVHINHIFESHDRKQQNI
jgi:hypothetical protein